MIFNTFDPGVMEGCNDVPELEITVGLEFGEIESGPEIVSEASDMPDLLQEYLIPIEYKFQNEPGFTDENLGDMIKPISSPENSGLELTVGREFGKIESDPEIISESTNLPDYLIPNDYSIENAPDFTEENLDDITKPISAPEDSGLELMVGLEFGEIESGPEIVSEPPDLQNFSDLPEYLIPAVSTYIIIQNQIYAHFQVLALSSNDCCIFFAFF